MTETRPPSLSTCRLAPIDNGDTTVNFADNFSPSSGRWSNSTGTWTASVGQYFGQQQNNNPSDAIINAVNDFFTPAAE